MLAGRISPHGRVVAVVDDDEAVCDSTRLLLEIQNFEVRTYLSGLDFLKDDAGVGCLVVDYHMPDLNGLELALELRARGSTSWPARRAARKISPRHRSRPFSRPGSHSAAAAGAVGGALGSLGSLPSFGEDFGSTAGGYLLNLVAQTTGGTVGSSVQ
ncbi:MAG: response regulator, partial [Acetobacteraceae bacterium]|nr:response regulator [Acetobacteraceae bacterium]